MNYSLFKSVSKLVFHTLENASFKMLTRFRALECDQFLTGATNKNPRAHWCVQPFEKRKKSIRDSETQQKTLRLISWSKPIRDSEGRTPPLIGRGPDIPVCVCAR